MKNLIIICLFLFVSSLAHAVYLPDFERPVMQNDDMEVSTAKSGFQKVEKVSLVINRRDDSAQPTSITLRISRADEKNETRKLFVTDIEKERCGSVKYLAEELNFDEGQYFITLVDHTFNNCKDEDHFNWEALVLHKIDPDGDRSETMHLSGNPKMTYILF